MTVTSETLLDKVNDLLPGIAARARSAEADRKPHDDSIKELIDAGVMQALVPKKYGGHELPLATLTAIARAISSACVSTGWVTAFYIGHNWMLTKFSEKLQQEVFAERPFTLAPIQPAPSIEINEVNGGYEVSGRSNFSSGIMHADWVIIAKSGGPDARAFVVPIEELQVDDVWHMAGMAATGSNDVIAEKVFVPVHRSLPAIELFNGTESIHDNPLYAMPLLPFIYSEVMGVYVGGLEGATGAFDEHLQKKVMTWGGDALATKQAVQIELGAAIAKADAAGTLLERLVVDTMAIAERRDFTVENRLHLKNRAAYLADFCRNGVNDIMSRSGTNNFRLDAPIQRFFRDINCLATHAFVDRDVAFELVGRQRFGLEPNHPLI